MGFGKIGSFSKSSFSFFGKSNCNTDDKRGGWSLGHGCDGKDNPPPPPADDKDDCGCGVEVVKGTSGDDSIVKAGGTQIILGLGGDDFLRGGNCTDFVFGGQGDDTIGGGDGKDFVFGGAGDDFITGGFGRDFLVGGVGNDWIVGSGEGDWMCGGTGADTFRIDATGYEDIILDFNFGEGDRIDIKPGYSLADATIVDNGSKHDGVTVSFHLAGEVDTIVTIRNVDSVADVISDWFI